MQVDVYNFRLGANREIELAADSRNEANSPKMFPETKGKAIVKSIRSGDSIIIRGKVNNGPPPEAILQLSMINSPRLGFKSSENDEVNTSISHFNFIFTFIFPEIRL